MTETFTHKQKHSILKSLAEAGTAIVVSSLPQKKKAALYSRTREMIDSVGTIKESGSCDCEIDRESGEPITLDQAINYLADGHTLWRAEVAYQICKVVGVPYDTSLENHCYSDWLDYKGLHMSEGEEGAIGVYSLSLSLYIAEKLGVAKKAGHYLGRGFQAQAYAEQIKKALKGEAGDDSPN